MEVLRTKNNIQEISFLKKEKKKEEQTSHLYIIHTSVYMQRNGKKIVDIIITIIIFVANIK